MSRTSVRVTCVSFPAASRATNVNVFAPAVTATVPLNPPSAAITNAVPFTVSVEGVRSRTDPLTATVAACVTVPESGDCTVITGAVASRVTVRVAVVVLPAASVATSVIDAIPSAASGSVVAYALVVACTATVAPFTVSVVAVASVIAPVTPIEVSVVTPESTGAAQPSAGACVSRTTVRVAVARKPAAFVATMVSVVLPSVIATSVANAPSAPSGVVVPFTASVTAVFPTAVPVTRAVSVLVTNPSAGPVSVRVGGVLSTVICRTTLVAFPAASVAVTITKFAPLASVIRCENVWLAESIASGWPFTLAVTVVRSVIVPVTVSDESARTVALSGIALSVTTGACVSRMTVRDESVRFPAASTALNTSWFFPSAASGTRAVKLVCPAVPGVTAASCPFTLIVTAVCSTTTPTASICICRVMSDGTGAVIVSRGASESVAMPHTVSREPGAPFITT